MIDDDPVFCTIDCLPGLGERVPLQVHRHEIRMIGQYQGTGVPSFPDLMDILEGVVPPVKVRIAFSDLFSVIASKAFESETLPGDTNLPRMECIHNLQLCNKIPGSDRSCASCCVPFFATSFSSMNM